MTVHEIDAERIVLGAMMQDPSVIPGAREKLGCTDFWDPKHATVFAAIVKNHEAGEPTEPVAVTRRLADSGDLRGALGAPFLHDVYAAAPGAAMVQYYVNLVAQAAYRRRVVEAAVRVQHATETGNVELVPAALASLADLAPPGSAFIGPWAPLDLGPHLRGEVRRPKPTVGFARKDGLRFLYPGKEHACVGEMEAGKSWFAIACVAAELLAGNVVVYVHFEETDPSDTIERLLLLGVPAATIEQLFRFVGPTEPGTIDGIAKLVALGPTLVVLDGVNEAMTMHGQAVREEDGAAAFRRRLVKPFTKAGAAVLALDHVIKDQEKRDRYAIGSIHKGNALNGVLIMLENAEPFGRGEKGRSHVFVAKDRPGHLRREGKPTKVPGKTYMGELIVDDRQMSTPDLELLITASAEEQTVPAAAEASDEDRVLAVVADLIAKTGVANLRAVRAAAGMSKDRTDNAIERLKLAGRLKERSGPNRQRLFSVAEDHSSIGDP